MKRRNGSGKFGAVSPGEEDINPMDGVANLADVMLVFACGIMLALITYWNVDMAGSSEGAVDVSRPQEITQDVDALDEEGQKVDSEGLERYGTVYIDPDTGRFYMVEN